MTARMTNLPLNHLRSFQVIGKHLSLVRAAQELHLTASALSYQLGLLEERLGAKLFVRNGRGLEFTDVGRKLHGKVDESLRQLTLALNEASGRTEDRDLVVSALHTFATRWLLPRFNRFPTQVANTEIRVSGVHANFDHDNVDCAICYGDGSWPGLTSDFLGDEYLVLVCAPSAISTQRPLQRFEDIQGHPLLEAKFRLEDWKLWLQEAKVALDSQQRVLTLESRNLVIEAAEAGLGLAVVDRAMVSKELESGRLIQPWPQAVKGPGAYYLAYPSDHVLSGKVLAFRDWLLSELAEPNAAE